MCGKVSQISVRLHDHDFEKLEGIIHVLYPLTGITEHTPLTLKIRITLHLAHHMIKDLDEDTVEKLREFIANLEL
jgi:hypothetical protein